MRLTKYLRRFSAWSDTASLETSSLGQDLLVIFGWFVGLSLLCLVLCICYTLYAVCYMIWTILYYTILYYTILYYAIQYNTIPEHTSRGLKFCAVCSWKPSESEAWCTRPRTITKAPKYPVRIIPEANLHGTASGYWPDTVLNIKFLGGMGGSKPWR